MLEAHPCPRSSRSSHLQLPRVTSDYQYIQAPRYRKTRRCVAMRLSMGHLGRSEPRPPVPLVCYAASNNPPSQYRGRDLLVGEVLVAFHVGETASREPKNSHATCVVVGGVMCWQGLVD